jgi:hypothetical protein
MQPFSPRGAAHLSAAGARLVRSHQKVTFLRTEAGIASEVEFLRDVCDAIRPRELDTVIIHDSDVFWSTRAAIEEQIGKLWHATRPVVATGAGFSDGIPHVSGSAIFARGDAFERMVNFAWETVRREGAPGHEFQKLGLPIARDVFLGYCYHKAGSQVDLVPVNRWYGATDFEGCRDFLVSRPGEPRKNLLYHCHTGEIPKYALVEYAINYVERSP